METGGQPSDGKVTEVVMNGQWLGMDWSPEDWRRNQEFKSPSFHFAVAFDHPRQCFL